MSSNSNSSQLERCSAGKRNTPLRSNMNESDPLVPKAPPPRLKYIRIFATVRVGLSVAVSINTATPCGPYPS